MFTNEDNNEEAGDHFTPRNVVSLMEKLLFLPVADHIQSTTSLLYDDACGTVGMLTVAENTLKALAAQHGKHALKAIKFTITLRSFLCQFVNLQ